MVEEYEMRRQCEFNIKCLSDVIKQKHYGGNSIYHNILKKYTLLLLLINERVYDEKDSRLGNIKVLESHVVYKISKRNEELLRLLDGYMISDLGKIVIGY